MKKNLISYFEERDLYFSYPYNQLQSQKTNKREREIEKIETFLNIPFQNKYL